MLADVGLVIIILLLLSDAKQVSIRLNLAA